MVVVLVVVAVVVVVVIVTSSYDRTSSKTSGSSGSSTSSSVSCNRKPLSTTVGGCCCCCQSMCQNDGQNATKSVMNKRWAGWEKSAKWKGTTGVYLDSGFGETTWAPLKDTMVCTRAEQVRLGRCLNAVRMGPGW